MLSPHGLTIIARAALLSFVVALVAGRFAPGPLSEDISWAYEAQWRAPWLFMAALMAQASFPGLRRSHLTGVALVAACGFELMIGLVAREPSLAKIVAGCAGVAAAWLPGLVDRLRARYRGQRFAPVVAIDKPDRAGVSALAAQRPTSP